MLNYYYRFKQEYFELVNTTKEQLKIFIEKYDVDNIQ
jgi:hypothetical protein